jgi:hypothetical protein
LNSTDIQAIAVMLKNNSASINADLIHQYISLLRLSFDVPELLVNYEAGLNILPLAKVCFLNKKIDVHVVATQFFYVLGYQGQLLDYYKNDPRFNITEQLSKKATYNLKQQAIDLQQYFFNNLDLHGELNKPLLQHYLYVQFFKPIYKENPTQLDALKTDRYLSHYIKFDYVALPKSIDCRDYLSADNKVIIEYNHLNTGIPEIACQAIACSSKSYEQWQASLGFYPTIKSRYIFRVGDSYEKYSFTYAYGESPRAGGFYLTGEVKNNTVNGIAYSYFNDKHQFIDVARHEEVHHKNFRLQLEAQKSNADITSLINRNFNEGLAVLFAGGACAPDYRSQDFSNTTAPSLETLLKNEYIGYSTSWLYNNYFIQEYPSFYPDLLRLGKNDFKEKWIPILNQDKDHFVNWLPYLEQVCKSAPKELSIENCPSIFLKDYLPAELKNPFITTTSHRSPRKSMPQITSRTTAARPNFYNDYLRVMHRIQDKNVSAIIEILKSTNYSADIVNYQDPERGLETPLHYALYTHGKNCSELAIQKLCNFGALPNFIDDRNTTAYSMSKNCDNWIKIKNIFDNQIQNLKKSTENNETGLISYSPKKYLVVIGSTIPIIETIKGSISKFWDRIAENFPHLENIIFYALKPISMAMTTAIMNILLYRRISYISSEATLVFCYYLGLNYLGMLSNQFGKKATQNIQNIYSKYFLQSLFNLFFTNPSLLGHLVFEGIQAEIFSLVLWPMLSMILGGVFFQAGEWVTQKVIGKFFPVNSENAATSSDLEILKNIEKNWQHVVKKIKKNINNQAYKLNFDEDIESATANITTLLEEISKDEQVVNRQEYEKVFKDFENVLVEIQKKLTKLLKSPKIQLLWEDVTTILTSLRSIRPLPQITPDLVANHATGVTIQEEQQIPLVTSFTDRNQMVFKNRSSMFNPFSSIFKPKPDFPVPPTEQELREMGIFVNENGNSSCSLN